MPAPVTLDTPRLILRQWQKSDSLSFARLNADPLVMKYFPKPLAQAESNELAARLQSLIDSNGWGFWALELKSSGKFIGFTGIQPNRSMPFSPCVEIGWRLASDYWRQGYATEAACQSLIYAFEDLQLTEVVSFTAALNLPSQGLMEKIGLRNTDRNFQHPALPVNHKLCEHVLYRISREQWHRPQ